MLVDLAMFDLDGCSLVKPFRQIPVFAHIKIVAITGHADQRHKPLAMKVGSDAVLFKPVAPIEIEAVLSSAVVANAGRAPRLPGRGRLGAERHVPIGKARRIRSERKSKTLAQAENESAICEGVICFQEEYMEWKSEQSYVHFTTTCW